MTRAITFLLTLACVWAVGSPALSLTYWTDTTSGAINRINEDGSGSLEVVLSGLNNPRGVGVHSTQDALDDFAQAWDAKYPTIAKQWRAKWTDIITLFDFPYPIRKAIYTTNAIESVNSVIRKFTRNRKIYPNEDSALKLIYMAISEASKRWTRPIHHWKQALNHFAILYEGRMPELN